MPAEFTNTAVFEHPWETVTAASWRKYTGIASPSEPNANPDPRLQHVISAHTVDRQVDGGSGTMQSTRLLTIEAPGPSWFKRFCGVRHVHIAENSVVDPKERVMVRKYRIVIDNLP